MKGMDAVLWERELAEHMSRHPDLQHLPPPAFPRRRRLQRLRVNSLLAIMMWVFVLISVTAVAGWWIGWYLI